MPGNQREVYLFWNPLPFFFAKEILVRRKKPVINHVMLVGDVKHAG